MKTPSSVFLIVAALALSACSISENVTPVKSSAIESPIEVLCIEKNDKVLMASFEPTLGRLIEEQGIEVRYFSNTRPEGCRHIARYVANWRWDFSMNLSYVRIEVFEDGWSIGVAEYDARWGGLNLGKFGSTEGKLRPLVSKLFVKS